MADAVRELLHLASPITMQVDGKELNTVTVKGFASVETLDRSQDVVPPTEFPIDQFMAAPSLLVNHKFWIDERGNRVPAGKVAAMNAVKLAKLNDEEYAVIDLKTKQQVNTFPKAKVPNLNVGDRGLFVVVEVSQPEIVKMVERGELSAFSWRGLVAVDYQINPLTGMSQRIYKNIDLYEVSLVNVPDNPDSTAMVSKAAHMMRLSKSRFETRDQATTYLNDHCLNTDFLREDDTAFYSRQLAPNRVDVEKLVIMKMTEGVDVIVGPLKEIDTWEARVLNEYSKIIALFDPSPADITKGERVMAEEKTPNKDQSVVADSDNKEVKKEVVEEKVEEKQVEEKVEESKEAKALNALGEHIAEKVSSTIVDGMKPFFEKMTGSMTMLGEGMSTIVKKMTPEEESKEEIKEEVEKSADKWDALNAMAETLTNLQGQLIEVAKSAQQAERTAKAVAGTTPKETTREEKIVEKSAEQDPNSVFDSVLPFLGAVG